MGNTTASPSLEAEWPAVAAALPLFLAGPNDRLQTLSDGLGTSWTSLAVGTSGWPFTNRQKPKRSRAPGLVEHGLGRLSGTVGCTFSAGGPWRCCSGLTAPRRTGRPPGPGARARLRHPPPRPRSPVGEGPRHPAIAAHQEALPHCSRAQPGERGCGVRPQRPHQSRVACGRHSHEHDYGETLRIAHKINSSKGVAENTRRPG